MFTEYRMILSRVMISKYITLSFLRKQHYTTTCNIKQLTYFNINKIDSAIDYDWLIKES